MVGVEGVIFLGCFFVFCVYIYMCIYVSVVKEVIILVSLELELWVNVIYLIWVLGSK